MRVTAKTGRGAFTRLPLAHLDAAGEAAVEQWEHVAWLPSAERRPGRGDYLNFKLLHNLSGSFFFVMIKQKCSIFIFVSPHCVPVASSSQHSLQSSSGRRLILPSIPPCQLLDFLHDPQFQVCYKSLRASTSRLSSPLLALPGLTSPVGLMNVSLALKAFSVFAPWCF